MPFLKNYKENSATSLITIFSIEHVMIAIVGILRLSYSGEPTWLNIFLKRRSAKAVKRQEKLEHTKKKTD